MHALLGVLGIGDPGGRWYAWWSGAGSDIGELAMIGWLLAFWRKHNCEVHRCPRLGRHPAGGHVVCRKHRPGGKVTAAEVAGAARDDAEAR